MISLSELYLSINEKLKEIKIRYDDVEKQYQSFNEQDELQKQKRIDYLQDQLKKIDEYKDKVEYFQRLAEKHIQSKNLLTITPRELNFNRLRNWSMMIDPTDSDDPYAQRIYVQTQCNEMFLRIKKDEYEKTLRLLTNDSDKLDDDMENSIKAVKLKLIDECKGILENDDFSELVEMIVKSNENNNCGFNHASKTKIDDKVGLGLYAQSFPILDELKYLAKEKLKEFYDERGFIFLPVEHSLYKETLITINCVMVKEKKLYRGIQNYLLNIINKTEAGGRKIIVLDALHFNNTALGFLRPLEGSDVIVPIPKDAESIVDTLKEIISNFSDIDEKLGMIDSVQEYNEKVEAKDRITRTILVTIGYPSAFSPEAAKYIKRILLNHEHYGISPIILNTQFAYKKNDDQNSIPIEVVDNTYHIQMIQKREIITQNNGSPHYFKWFELTNELDDSFIHNIKSSANQPNILGTEYIKRINMENYPPYKRGMKSIVLPYGVDSKDEVKSISFDNENFASYMMGASGSGKSTLLHTLITGIIRNYHPDDVELWLADFKMSEFAQYMNPLAPHIKYILLDESPELVYDLIDQLTEKMMDRQRFFMKHRDMKKVENVPVTIYMPIIFVILDEFSIMSQAVSESEAYKLKLQNLLAKGRALGIKFIFSSQTFTKGIAGLTKTAKDQIQTRIAMKNSYEEINETLELTSNTRTEQVKNWMEALPPHFALFKFRDGDHLQVNRLQVMYFKGKGDEALEPQRKLIRHLNDTMIKISEKDYDSKVLEAYVDKKAVIVDGNSYTSFCTERISSLILEYKKENEMDISDEDMVLTFGTPRRMVNAKFSIISNESRENILLIARSSEQACGMSLVLTAIKSYEIQKGNVQIWAYKKNRFYRTYKNSHLIQYDINEGLDAICPAIKSMKEKIKRKESGNELIILMGMEQICSDFELIDFTDSGTDIKNIVASIKNCSVSTIEGELQYSQMNNSRDRFEQLYNIPKLENDMMDEGKSVDEILEEIEKLYKDFLSKEEPFEKQDISKNQKSKNLESTLCDNESAEEVVKPYNALEDFQYIVKQGSRFGYHFMLVLTDLSDLKNTHLQQALFRHKLAFQVSTDDSFTMFSSKAAAKLPAHICQYGNMLETYSLRPFIHEGILWDGWYIDENGEATNSVL